MNQLESHRFSYAAFDGDTHASGLNGVVGHGFFLWVRLRLCLSEVEVQVSKHKNAMGGRLAPTLTSTTSHSCNELIAQRDEMTLLMIKATVEVDSLLLSRGNSRFALG